MLTPDPFQMRLSGTGGQGLILAGVILADAAIRQGLEVIQTQSYGPEARLGASCSEIIFSSREIAYPQVMNPDLLLCLSQEAFQKFSPQMRDGSMIIADHSCFTESMRPITGKTKSLPILETAKRVGSKQIANVVALGALNAMLNLVSLDALKESLMQRVPERFRELNEAALLAGNSLIQEAVTQTT
jgi:2-oxoglutarate ferredoxin oxidoreductase subunit gamma